MGFEDDFFVEFRSIDNYGIQVYEYSSLKDLLEAITKESLAIIESNLKDEKSFLTTEEYNIVLREEIVEDLKQHGNTHLKKNYHFLMSMF